MADKSAPLKGGAAGEGFFCFVLSPPEGAAPEGLFAGEKPFFFSVSERSGRLFKGSPAGGEELSAPLSSPKKEFKRLNIPNLSIYISPFRQKNP